MKRTELSTLYYVTKTNRKGVKQDRVIELDLVEGTVRNFAPDKADTAGNKRPEENVVRELKKAFHARQISHFMKDRETVFIEFETFSSQRQSPYHLTFHSSYATDFFMGELTRMKELDTVAWKHDALSQSEVMFRSGKKWRKGYLILTIDRLYVFKDRPQAGTLLAPLFVCGLLDKYVAMDHEKGKNAVCLAHHGRGRASAAPFEDSLVAFRTDSESKTQHMLDEVSNAAARATAAVKLQAFSRMLIQKQRFLRLKRAIKTLKAVYITQYDRFLFNEKRRAILAIQSNIRMYQARNRFARKRQAAITIQYAWRNYARMRNAAIVCQAAARMYFAKKHFRLAVTAATAIQRAWRRYVEWTNAATVITKTWRMYVEWMKFNEKKYAAISIQSAWRMWRCRHIFLHERRSAVIIQSFARMAIDRSRFVSQREAAVKLQAMARMSAAKKRYIAQRKATIALQVQARYALARRRYLRMRRAALLFQARWRFSRERKAATAIQNWLRTVVANRRFREQRAGAVRIQKTWRMYSLKSSLGKKREAVTLIRAHWLRHRAQTNFIARKNATRTLQQWWRARVARMRYTRVLRGFILIQSLWRGHCVRKRVLIRGSLFSQKPIPLLELLRLMTKSRKEAAVRIQSAWRGLVARRQGLDLTLNTHEREMRMLSLMNSVLTQTGEWERDAKILSQYKKHMAGGGELSLKKMQASALSIDTVRLMLVKVSFGSHSFIASIEQSLINSFDDLLDVIFTSVEAKLGARAPKKDDIVLKFLHEDDFVVLEDDTGLRTWKENVEETAASGKKIVSSLYISRRKDEEALLRVDEDIPSGPIPEPPPGPPVFVAGGVMQHLKKTGIMGKILYTHATTVQADPTDFERREAIMQSIRQHREDVLLRKVTPKVKQFIPKSTSSSYAEKISKQIQMRRQFGYGSDDEQSLSDDDKEDDVWETDAGYVNKSSVGDVVGISSGFYEEEFDEEQEVAPVLPKFSNIADEAKKKAFSAVEVTKLEKVDVSYEANGDAASDYLINLAKELLHEDTPSEFADMGKSEAVETSIGEEADVMDISDLRRRYLEEEGLENEAVGKGDAEGEPEDEDEDDSYESRLAKLQMDMEGYI